MEEVKKQRGGRREGAGRKQRSESGKARPVGVSMTPEDIERFRALGGAVWFSKMLEREWAAKQRAEGNEA